MKKNLRIACYGFVKKNHGSLVGANYMVLEELLIRGHHIDFFNRKDFVYPQELLEYENFNYIDVKRPPLKIFLIKLFKGSKTMVPVINLLTTKLNSDAFCEEILTNHHVKKYDLLVALGCYSKFKVDDIPTLAWVQGPPHTERYFNLQKLWKEILLIDGVVLYIKLLFFYAFKMNFGMPKVENQDLVICGSQWSKKQLISYGFKADTIKVLPYPVDLNLFQLSQLDNDVKQDNKKVFLWLGRTDPRKRLDLLLKSFALVLKERQDVQLKIFTRFPYAKGYKKLIDRFEYPKYVEYQPHIDRSQIPQLMSKCDFIVQPSEGENFGFAVAEGLCCRLPVILGQTNGTKDYIGSSSFIFEDYTSESIKETMLKAIKASEEDRESLMLDARRAAENNLDVTKIVDNFEKILNQLFVF